MNSADRVALLAGIITIIAALGAMLRVLMKISWEMGQLAQRFTDHVEASAKTGTDFETRIRALERPYRRRY